MIKSLLVVSDERVSRRCSHGANLARKRAQQLHDFGATPAVEHVAAAALLDAGASIVTGSEMPAEHRDAVGHKSLKEYRR